MSKKLSARAQKEKAKQQNAAEGTLISRFKGAIMIDPHKSEEQIHTLIEKYAAQLDQERKMYGVVVIERRDPITGRISWYTIDKQTDVKAFAEQSVRGSLYRVVA